ncbi:MAG: putative enzyme related to lactoylglutathione lyase [Kiritimatiellia bacterium]|jgi:predicted enzyme related to lactoylglutathione lyase
MATQDLTFCWNGFVSTDVQATLAFFPEVVGWNTTTVQMGDNEVVMFSVGEQVIGHVRGPQMDGEPSWWNNYLRVADVDVAAAAVVAHGGTVVVPATDIPPGRFATVATPSGAYFTLFREAGEATPDAEGIGSIHWRELHSKDLDVDLSFLKGALGFESSVMDMPNGPYHLLNPETEARIGVVAGMHPDAPSMWLAWIHVTDVDETAGRVETHGGKIVAPAFDVPGVGRLAIASDPAGVVFGVITPPAS